MGVWEYGNVNRLTISDYRSLVNRQPPTLPAGGQAPTVNDVKHNFQQATC